MSEQKITGKITHILPTITGESAKGTWEKKTFVIETADKYPKSVAFDIFGGKAFDNFNQYNKIGDVVEVSYNLESREYEGRWFTNVNAWKIWKEERQGITTQPQEQTPIGEGMEPYDLPF